MKKDCVVNRATGRVRFWGVTSREGKLVASNGEHIAVKIAGHKAWLKQHEQIQMPTKFVVLKLVMPSNGFAKPDHLKPDEEWYSCTEVLEFPLNEKANVEGGRTYRR